MKLRVITLCCLLISFAPSAYGETAPQNAKPKRGDKIWPLFRGEADETFAAWVGEKLVYPEDLADQKGASEETVVGFTIGENGTVSKIIYIENPLPALSEQLKTIVSGSPAWTPAYKKKKAEETAYFLFVNPLLKEVRLVSEKNGEFVEPTFNGKGLTEFRRWVAENIEYPLQILNQELRQQQVAQSSGRESRVVMRFYVDREGTAVFDKLVSSSAAEFTEEVLKGLEKAPKWIPGTLDGVRIPVYFELTIVFSIGGAYSPTRTIH